MTTIKELTKKLTQFRDARDWKQFHNTKDLALALSIEAAELNELFLWKNPEESEAVNEDRIKEELADILTYALLIAEKHQFDIKEIVSNKIKLNNAKYPVEKAKGTSKKYNEL